MTLKYRLRDQQCSSLAEHMLPPPTAATHYRRKPVTKETQKSKSGIRGPRIGKAFFLKHHHEGVSVWEPDCEWGRTVISVELWEACVLYLRTEPSARDCSIDWGDGQSSQCRDWAAGWSCTMETLEPCCWGRLSFWNQWKPFNIL